MGNISTFGTYALARLGIYAAQSAVTITGNNIANVSTIGYTRQFIDQVSLNMGGADRYASKMDTRIGSGAFVYGVTQLRDPYLDIRYRNEQTHVGTYEGWMEGLNQLANIFDEVGRGDDEAGILEARFNELIQQLQNLNTEGAGMDEFDTLVRSACTSIANTFHSYASQLETILKNQDTYFRQEVDKVNTILERIRDLNSTIHKTEVYGGNALELKDERNVLIDELSKYLKINVTYEQDKLGEGLYVDRLVITTGNEPQRTLVNGAYCTQLSIQQVPKQKFDENGKPLYEADGKTPQYERDKDGNIIYIDDPLYRLELGPLLDKYDRELRTKTGSETVDNFSSADYAGEPDAQAAAKAAAEERKAELEANGSDDVGNVYVYSIRESVEGTEDNPIYKYEVVKTTYSNGAALLNDTELEGKLQSEREVLTEKGEYATEADLALDREAAVKRGIPYYMKALDTLANSFANALNWANVTAGLAANGFTMDDYNGWDTDKQKEFLSKYLLFSNDGTGNDPEGINASNINISHVWSIHEAKILESRLPNAGNTDNDNLQYFLALLTNDLKFGTDSYKDFTEFLDPKTLPETDPPDMNLTFTGTFQEFLTTHMAGTLANDMMTYQTMQDNHEITLEDLYIERDSIMGVDLNDEAMNLMQYQKAYQAACRLMTTYDEMLNKLINGT